jgi:hypothetical protein
MINIGSTVTADGCDLVKGTTMETSVQAPNALTSAQRYFYDVNGYVILRGVFTEAECRCFMELAQRMDADDGCLYKYDGYPKTPIRTVLSRCAWYDPHLLETAMSPRLLPVIEDVVGGEVRLEEHQIIINYPDPDETWETYRAVPVAKEGWHRAVAPSFGSFQSDGRTHCLFAKALIYLTRNGPGEGTWVVPGSHRLELPSRQLVEFMDESLALQLQVDVGDVLILSETLIHAGPRLQPGSTARYSLIYGYTAPFMQTWNRYDPPSELLERVSPEQRRFLTGETRYGFRRGQF